jgi:hypothetical protein
MERNDLKYQKNQLVHLKIILSILQKTLAPMVLRLLKCYSHERSLYLKRGHDQFMQATRGGKQNHAHGVTEGVWLQALVQGVCRAREMFILD